MAQLSLDNWLKFEDWLKEKDASPYWTTVAQSIKTKEGDTSSDFFTISILCESDDPSNCLNTYEWLADVEFGNPSVWTDNFGLSGEKGELKYAQNCRVEKDECVCEPFTILRSWYHKSWNSYFELIQDFYLFYNLYSPDNGKSWKALSETGEEFEVVKISKQKGLKRIEINTKFLRNYLAIKQKILVRQHQHLRRKKNYAEEFERQDNELKNTSYCFNHWITKLDVSKNELMAQLSGKDVILPLDKGSALLEWNRGEFTEFLIGKDKTGTEVSETCDENVLSNYFVDRGKPHYLTPVFFKRDVLQKYYDNPSIYAVDSSVLKCGGLWSLRIDVTDNGFVHAWLGDLGHIPPYEQKHWRQFNVATDEKITESRFRRDFMAEWVGPEEPVMKFNHAFQSFQKRFKEKFGFDAFMPLKQEDEYIYGDIRIPLSNEQPEFDQQIKNFAKLLPDSINIGEINSYLQSQGMSEDDLQKYQIYALDSLLEYEGASRELTPPLKLLQALRSSCIAHRRGSKCVKLLAKEGLAETSNVELVKGIVTRITDAFEATQFSSDASE